VLELPPIEGHIGFFKSRASFGSWLSRNSATSSAIWLRIYTKTSGKKSLTFEQAVYEARFFGWVDVENHRFDDVSYLHKFMRREPLN